MGTLAPPRRAALPERYQMVRLVIETHNQTSRLSEAPRRSLT